MEVIYTRYAYPEEIVKIAIDEDVDVIGISFLSGGQLYVISQLTKLLKKQDLNDMLLIVGGAIYGDDIPQLLAMGVSRVFGIGMPKQEIADFITSTIKEKE